MFLGRQEGMSTVSVLALVGAASGIILTTSQILETAKKNFKIAEIQSVIDIEVNQIELLLVDPVACRNTFGPANTGGASIAGANPGASVNVANIIDGEAIPNVVINTAVADSSYFPRNPTLPAAGAARTTDRQGRSQVLLTRFGVSQGNNTGIPIQFIDNTVAADLTVNNNQFAVSLNFQLDPVTNKVAVGTAGGQQTNFFRTILMNATFNGLGQVTTCSSARSGFLDQRYVNMKRDDRILVPLALLGRVSVFPIAGFPWTGYVSSVRLYAISDENQKEAIKLIENPSEKLNKIEGKLFNWKDGPKNDSGVIAQDIEKVLPDLVINENDSKSVNYNSLIALSTAALKDEMQATQELENSLNQMKIRVQKLKEKNHALKK
jgi:hypothetical protein